MTEKKDEKLYLDDILLSINKIIKYINKIDETSFKKNEMMIDAVIRNLAIIGEASSKISRNFKSSNDEIPWQRMTGLRNILIHEYFGVDIDIIWKIVSENIPETKSLIEKVLNSLE